MRNFSIPLVVKSLLIANALFFAATYAFEQGQVNLVAYLALFYFDSPFLQPHQLITYMFMHADLGHLFVNMFMLWMIGSHLENVWGPKRFLIYYMICGIGAAILYSGMNATDLYMLTGNLSVESPESLSKAIQQIYFGPMLGASGAVFGVLLAFGVLFPNIEMMFIFIPVPIKAKYMVFGLGALEFFSGMQRNPDDNVAHFAHLGGMLVGFILIRIWKLKPNN